ncbi:hypothetical protein [Curvivirga sp.]|uniref:hypothetical protein n=1 Tax=Curvivirga sp. TaxID=2856848 RepID=UPI003B5BA4CF
MKILIEWADKQVEWDSTRNFLYVKLSFFGEMYLDRTVTTGHWFKYEEEENGEGCLWLCRRPLHYTNYSRHTSTTSEELAANNEQFWKEVLEEEEQQNRLSIAPEHQPS